MKEVLATCHNCNAESPCLEKDMSEKTLTMENGQTIFATVWTCPVCGFEHIVQLDDENTKNLFEQLRLRMSRLRRTITMGKRAPQSEIDALDRIQTELDDARIVLNTRYDGSLYQFDGQTFKLELCPPDAKISGEREEQNVHE